MFSENHIATIGAEFHNVVLEVPIPPENAPVAVRVQLWDTAGQERYRSVAPAYYRGAPAVIVMYNVCAKSSFTAVASWLSEAAAHLGHDGAVFALMGNKIDLADASGVGLREVSRDDGEALAAAHGMLFAETSAKTGAGVADAYVAVAAAVLADEDARDRCTAQRHGARASGISIPPPPRKGVDTRPLAGLRVVGDDGEAAAEAEDAGGCCF